MLALEGETTFSDVITRTAEKPDVQRFIATLHDAGIRHVRCRAADEFDFAVDRRAGTADIQCPGSERHYESGFVSALHGLVRAVGGVAPLGAGFDSLSWQDSLAQGMVERRVPVSEPVYGERALFRLVVDFAIHERRLAAILAPFKGGEVDRDEIFGSHFSVIQCGVHQAVLAARIWVRWQAEPIKFAMLVAMAPPGHQIRTARGGVIVVDEIVRREAEHLAENHRYSPDLYDEPLDSGYGAFGVGALDRAFLYVMPFKDGYYELSPALHYDAAGVARRSYRLNAARRVERADKQFSFMPVPIAPEHYAAIDRANVAAVVKHWARSFVATGEGLIDTELSLLAGDHNIQAQIGPEIATLPPIVHVWRIAARGRTVADLDLLVEYLLSPVEQAPIENAPTELSPVYLAGDPGDDAGRRRITWRGALEGLEQSGVSAAVKVHLEAELRRRLGV